MIRSQVKGIGRCSANSRVAAPISKLELGVSSGPVQADAHGLRQLPEFYDESQARAEKHHIAGVLLHQVQKDDDLHHSSLAGDQVHAMVFVISSTLSHDQL